MKRNQAPLATAFALALATSMACTPAPDDGGGTTPGTGGSSSSSGTGGSKGTGGSPAGTGGSSSSTGSGGSSSSGTGGTTTAGTGGSSSSGTGGATSPGTGGSTSAGTGGTTTTPDAGGGSDLPTAGGKMMITIDSDPATSTPTRLCFKPEASSGGAGGPDKSPKIDWSTPPAGTQSLVLMMEDLSNTTPHRIVCNIKPTETGQAADIKAKVPEGAQAGTGHGKPNDTWYGPGAGGAAHKYEITIFALATPTLEGGCGPGKKAIPARDYLKKNKDNKAIVLDWDAKILWGNSAGKCTP
jgi:phosphatidylethanolamine-binding protein (PEBP) family uncharacterized protein